VDEPAELHRWFLNPRVDPGTEYPAALGRILDRSRAAEAAAEIATWDGYEPSPLRLLDGLAERTGVRSVWYKDESDRFGVGSFKSLGGAYGVFQTVRRVLADRSLAVGVTSSDLQSGVYREALSNITVTCATAGNHGRAVAWGARMFGCACVVFLPPSATVHRERAMTALGAEVIWTSGNYEDAVREAESRARSDGWYVVSDTSYPGNETIPTDIMHGYMLLAAEALLQMGTEGPPTHVFAQAGVGGLAAAVCASMWQNLGADRPTFIVVEPLTAACCLASARAGRPTSVPNNHDTIMACLATGEVSSVAWGILDTGAHAFLAIPDGSVHDALALLSEGAGGEPIVVGESGCSGVAGLLAIQEDAACREALGLTSESRVLLIGSEGVNDNPRH
jgi:diaminopropionate ammonia-lyase